MNWQTTFKVGIRIVFLFAFIAFLSASVSHVAVFFNNFEADKSNWIEPYMLAISIDLTALVLTIGVMFFRKDMPWYALLITWLFIIGLTTFSWITNWEYASTYQGSLLKTNSILSMLNPILASSFAFFNLVYSFVSEFFGMKVRTADDLLAEADRLEALEVAQRRIDAYKDRNRKTSLIQRAKATAIEAKSALSEVVSKEMKTNDDMAPEADLAHEIIPVIDEPMAEYEPVFEEMDAEQDNGVHNEEDNELLEVLNNYPKVASCWLAKEQKSASLEEIIKVTGHSKRRLNKVAFIRAPRNKELILISSVIEWLRTAPLPSQNQQDTDPLNVVSNNGHQRITTPLNGFVEMAI